MRSLLLNTGLLSAFLLLPFAAQASRYCPYRVCHSYDQFGVCNNYTCGDPIHYGGTDRYDDDDRYDRGRSDGDRRYYYYDRYDIRRYPAAYDWNYRRSYYYDWNYDSSWDRERIYIPQAGYYYRS